MEIVKRVLVAGLNARDEELRWKRLCYGARSDRPFRCHKVELGVVLEGRLRRHYEGFHLDVGPGEVWFTGMWEIQSWEVLEAPCHELVFFVAPEVLVDLHFAEVPDANWLLPFMVAPQLRPRPSEHQRERVRLLAQHAVELHRQQAEDLWGQTDPAREDAPQNDQVLWRRQCAPAPAQTRLRLRLIFVQLLLHLLSDWHPASRVTHHDPYSQIGPAILRALQSHELVTTQEAARLCGLNRNLFGRRFQEMMGLSFSEFSLRRRLQGAADDLSENHEPVKTIAAHWGFVNGAHLHRCFARHYGCTPAQFRREPPSGLWHIQNHATRDAQDSPGAAPS